MKGIFNHMRCVDVLQAMDIVDGERIGVIGHSLGGHNAMFVGVFDERLKVIVSSCGWTPFHDYYSGNIKGWTSDRYMPRLRDVYDLDPAKVPFDFYEIVAALAPRAFFSSSPVDDANFDVAGVRKTVPEARAVYDLFDAGGQLKVVYPECDHDFPTETRSEAYQFIDSVLQHTPKSDIDYSAELPRILPREPAEALNSFKLVEGFQIRQTAAEPLVTDPVAMSFDPDGRLYVAEMKDYSEQENDFLGQVRLLEDTNNDGVFDKSHVFADTLSWPTAILYYDGGVFVGAPPDLMYFKDTDGDQKADVKRTVFTGFGRSNVQGLMNCLRWGIDNRVHGAASSAGGQVRRPDQPESEAINIRGHDFSFDPRQLDLRLESGGAQHGMCFDDWGQKFVCSNSDHAQMVVYDERYAARNPSLKARSPRTRIAVDGGQAPVFRISQVEPWRIVRTRLRVSGAVGGPVEGGGRAAGYFTGATGITIYRGDAWPAHTRGTAFIADVGSNIIHRKKVEPDGVVYKATRVDSNREFLASDDVWFRPVQFSNAPDGCLHILDMYRETIEHPKSLPPQIKQHLDLTSGRNRGRLYRIVPDDFKGRPQPELSNLSSSELVAMLNHRNGWHREMAAQLIYERNDQAVVALLTDVARNGELPEARIHSLHLLSSLQSLNPETVLSALSDGHPRVREHALKLAESLGSNEAIGQRLVELSSDENLRVRFQLAFTVGEFSDDTKLRILPELLMRDGADPWCRMAAISSSAKINSRLLAAVISNPKFSESDHSGEILTELAATINPSSDVEAIGDLTNTLTAIADSDVKNAQDVLRKLLQHAPRLATALRQDTKLNGILDSVINDSRTTLADDSNSIVDRMNAIELLAAAGNSSDVQVILKLIGARQPASVQQAAMAQLRRFQADSIAQHVLGQWAVLTPTLRRDAEELLTSRPNWIELLLKAVDEGNLKPSDISVSRWTQLANHRNSTIRAKATKLRTATTPSDRTELIEKYKPALQIAGDAERGKTVFRKTCSVCHKVENHGHELGPNLMTMRNRGREAILLNILDPNREVNPQYLSYVAVDTDGLTHTGMITDESSTVVTLTRAENRQSTLLRTDIEELRSSGQSLMPVGIEKDIDVQAMADLIAYLMQMH